MAISYIAAGLAANNATSAAIPYPAGIAAGDLLLLCAVAKYTAYTSAPPTGFTLLREQVGGSGGTGIDAGDIRLAVWYKVAVGTETGSINVTKATQTGSVILGRMFLFRKSGPANWSVTGTSGTDTTGATSWSVTGAANINLDAGDRVVMVSGMNTDVATYTAHALSATGSTFGTLTERQDSGTTTGDDVGLLMAEGDVTTGPSTAAPIYTATASTGTPEGASIIVRLREQRLVTAALGSYTLTGPDTRLQGPAALPNAWAPGAWYSGTWLGTAWYRSTLKFMPATRGTFAYTGYDAGLRIGYRITAEPVVVELAGKDAALRYTRIMPATQGYFALTGYDVNLEYHALVVRTIPIDVAPYALSGQDVTFRLARRMPAGIGNYLLTGQSATLVPGARKMAARQGSYTLTGNTTFFLRSNVTGKAWAQGAWKSDAWKGTSWSADYTGKTNYSMQAVFGEYDQSGIDIPFHVGHHIDAETGLYVYTGDDALRDMLFHTDLGTYALTGVNATGGKGRSISAGQGTYAVTGQDANLLYGRRFEASFGAYLFIGGSVSFSTGSGTALTFIPYQLTGYDATFSRAYRLTAESGSYSLAGQDANIFFGNLFHLQSIPYVLTGYPVALSRTYSILAETGYYRISGQIAEPVPIPPPRRMEAGTAPAKQPRIFVEINGQKHTVRSIDEARYILKQILEDAEKKAKEELAKALESKQRLSRIKSVVAHKLRTPSIRLDASEDVLGAIQREVEDIEGKIKEIYDDALRNAEIGILLRRQKEIQEEEDFMTGLFL